MTDVNEFPSQRGSSRFLMVKYLSPGIPNQLIYSKAWFPSKRGPLLPIHPPKSRRWLRMSGTHSAENFLEAGVEIRLIQSTYASETMRYGPEIATRFRSPNFSRFFPVASNRFVKLVLASAGVHIYNLCSQLLFRPTSYVNSGAIDW